MLLIAGVLLLHAGSYGYPPVFDDGAILDAGALQQMADACAALSSRCITFTTFGLTYLAAGLDLFWFHFGNVLLHGLAALACFLFFDRLFEAVRGQAPDGAAETLRYGRLLAFCGAVWFAVHPVTVYGVTYLAQRSIVLATLFSLLALAAFVRALSGGGRRWLWLSVLLYGAALLSKEHAILLPAVAAAIFVLLGGKLPGSRIEQAVAGGLIAAAGALVAYRLAGLLGTSLYEYYVRELGAATGDAKSAYLGSVVTQAGLFFKYLLLWLVPYPGWMSVDLRQSVADGPLAWPHVLGVPVFLAWGGGAVVLLRRRGAAGLLGLGMLFPWLLFFTEFAAARIQEPFVLYRSYLWMAGLPAALPYLARRLTARSIMAGGAVIALVLAVGMRERLSTFASDFALWDDVVRKNTDLSRVFVDRGYVNRAVPLMRAGRLDEALRDAETALKLNPRNTHAFLNRGTVRSRRGDAAGALADFERAIALDPDFAEAHAERCAVLLMGGQSDHARESCDTALRLAPRMSKALVNRAVLSARAGRMPEALADLDRALQSDPGSAIALYNRGMVYQEMGREAQSGRDLDAACRLGLAQACAARR